MKPIIAIDGLAASGKGTLARNLAKDLGFAHMDTGALYRAVGLAALETGADFTDEASLTEKTEFFVRNFNPALLDEPRLRTDETGQAASKVAAIPAVRALLLNLQQDFAKDPGSLYKGAILDGRDIGTVICPNAQAKLFITAKTEIRALRRTKELQSKGISVSYEAVLDDMRERDKRDAQRKAAPAKAAGDAYVINTDELPADQAFEKAKEFVKTKIPAL